MSNKKELVGILDINLFGTFSRFVEKATEQNFVYLEYVPLNSFPPKRVLHPVAISKDNIHMTHSSKDYPGVEQRVIYIYTAEVGSVVKDVFNADNIKIIEELREKIRKLQMQVATTKQESEDARSGVNKTIAAMKQVSRATQPANPFDTGFGRPFGGAMPPQQEYDDFDNY